MYVDTNVILRALLNDHPEQSPKAQSFFTHAQRKGMQLRTSEAVLAEVFYVLESVHVTPHLSREAIADLVADFVTVSGIDFPSKEYILKIITAYKKHTIDFVDVLLSVNIMIPKNWTTC
jgi:predicted nucleic-acid-binding protein